MGIKGRELGKWRGKSVEKKSDRNRGGGAKVG